MYGNSLIWVKGKKNRMPTSSSNGKQLRCQLWCIQSFFLQASAVNILKWNESDWNRSRTFDAFFAGMAKKSVPIHK